MIITNTGIPILIDEEDRVHLEQQTWSVAQVGGGKNFYASADIEGARVYMHRLLLGLSKDDPRYADHINGCTLDNRKENLRAVSPQQNCWNLKRSKRNQFGFPGVSFNRLMQKYQARVYRGGRRVSLGYFATVEEAAETYAKARAQIEREIFNVAA